MYIQQAAAGIQAASIINSAFFDGIRGKTRDFGGAIERTKTQNAITAVAEANGFVNRNTSRGSYTLGVLSHPLVPKRIIKLCSTDPYGELDNYMLYAHWVYENGMWQTNPHYPRIYDIAYEDDVAIVVMEELDAFPWDQAAVWLKDDYSLARSILTGQSPILINDDHSNRPLTTAAESIKRFMSDNKLRQDLHKNNVMLRGDILVITDPVA